MKSAVLIAALACGCAGGSVLRIMADAFGMACDLRTASARRPVAFDIYPDGGVRPVYAESPR